MGLEFLFDMGMCLGEGSGAVLLMYIVEVAVRCFSDMIIFVEVGVSEKIGDDTEEVVF